MYKIELFYRELLYQSIENSNNNFTIQALANKFKLSLSTVHHGVKPLANLGIVEIHKRQSSVRDVIRFLYYWATKRNLKKDIIYQTYTNLSVSQIESSMPQDALPTAYSACRLYYNQTPADYDHVYFYGKSINTIKIRFPQNSKKYPNLFILKPDPYLFSYKTTPLCQIFADLWNCPEWYRHEYSEAIVKIIKSKIGL